MSKKTLPQTERVPHYKVPRHSLEDALRVPRMMYQAFALGSVENEKVARLLGYSPSSATFKSLLRSAAAYELINLNDSKIDVTDLGRHIVATNDPIAKRHAIRRPDIFRTFIAKFDGQPMPPDVGARNALELMGLPPHLAELALRLLLDNLKEVGALIEMGGLRFIDMTSESLHNSAPTPFVADVFDRAESPSPSSVFERRRGRTIDGGLRRDLRVDAYILVKRLGSGYSAEVWSARVAEPPPGVDLEPNADVAIKFFHPHVIAIPEQVIRIEREYRIASTLRHPNLIRIYEFLLASSRPHHNFVVMDIAKGQSLRNIIPATGLSVQKTLQIAEQLLKALDELHAAGALHRDVKPGNIAVAEEPGGLHVTLLDLGIVSVAHERSLTVATRFLGSKHWAPYEQLVGQPLDTRSDLYSFAAVVYNMLTGGEPYGTQTTEAAVAVEMLQRPLRLPDTVNLPQPVRELLNACLSSDIRNRPRSATECLDLIHPHL